jgi:phosphoenolpyruvate-protein kinase (PTS system EI component)
VCGVVTETGGLLSHAAVICREYGLFPAVLRCARRDDADSGRAARVEASEAVMDLLSWKLNGRNHWAGGRESASSQQKL